MALKKCKECGHDVSTKADACPNCGAVKKTTSGCTGCIAILFMIFFVPWCVGSLSDSDSSTPHQTVQKSITTHDKVTAYVIAKDFVENQLKSPGTAKWPWDNTDKVTKHLGNGEYTIRTYVDSQNSFGALIRTNFSCTVQYTGNEKWKLVDFKVIK